MLTKSKKKVTGKIPENGNARGHQLGQVEILFAFVVHIIQHTGINGKPYDGHNDKLAVLEENAGIVAVKSPCPVYKIIGRCRNNKTHGIGKIFVGLNNFFKEIGDAEINDHPNKTSYAEAQELKDEILDV
jgi:hypothetical protein